MLKSKNVAKYFATGTWPASYFRSYFVVGNAKFCKVSCRYGNSTVWDLNITFRHLNQLLSSLVVIRFILTFSESFEDKKTKIIWILPSRHLLVQSQQLKLRNNVWTLFNVSNKNLELAQWRRCGLPAFKFEQISYIVLVFLLLDLNR